MAEGPRVLFFGMRGAFSRPSLEALLAAGLPVCAVVVPGPRSGPPLRSIPPASLRVLNHRSIVEVAWDHGLPVIETSDLTALPLDELRPEAIAVACFDRLVPRGVRERVSLAVNVHPSLLPDNRGPMPLFWTFRRGQAVTGVTVHLLEDRADAGAILAQRRLPVEHGIEGALLERQLAELGGELLVDILRKPPDPVPQDESAATAFGSPVPDDWVVPLDWPASRAYDFIRGVFHLGGPLAIAGHQVVEAVAVDGPPPVEPGLLQIRMNPGLLTVRVLYS